MEVIVCQCGRVLHGESEREVVEAMTRHLETDHPQLAGAATEADLLAMIEPAP